MAKTVRDQDGLIPREAKAAILRAQGLSQVEAYSQVFAIKRMSQKTAYERASRLFAKPVMGASTIGRVRQVRPDRFRHIERCHTARSCRNKSP